METNCRKLVSACVQLGKSPLLPGGPWKGDCAKLGRREAGAPQGGPLQLELSPARGLILKGNQTSRTALALSFGGGLGSGDPTRPAPTLLRTACRSGGTGTVHRPHWVVRDSKGWACGRSFSNGVFALYPFFSSVPPCPLTLALARGAFPPPFGVPCHRTWGGRTRGPGVQPAAVECLFSKDSEIKKVEFTDSPESRKEAASSKLFPRQHPGANGKGEGSAGRAPGSRLRDSGPPVKPWRAKLLEPVCPRCRT